MLMHDGIPDFSEWRVRTRMNANSFILSRLRLAMAGDFLFHAGHNAFGFGWRP